MSPRSPLRTGHQGLRLIAEVDSLSEDGMAAIGFRFTAIHLTQQPNGWLLVQVDWSAERDEWRVRNGVHSSSGYGWHSGNLEAATVEIEFPEVNAPYYSPGHSPFEVYDGAAQHKACINLGLAVKQRRGQFTKLPWDLVYHQRVKYGAYIHYAPRGWDQGDYKPLFGWRERRRA